jgi:Glycosyl hydrolases family 2, sugar binding domain/Glycosyl hydrolases family 2, TIM barrel domain/Glycosyl hydrolases family 2
MKLSLALALFTLPALFAADWKPADSPLTTPWTAQVNPAHALPEYPRPQMARKDWTNLNGLWDYAILPQEQTAASKYDGSILVPFPVESALSGVKAALAPDKRLWYRRTFTAPSLKGKRLLLHFGAVDWRAEVWVNGKAVGKHEGGYDPFTFDITAAIKAKGPEEIVVAVWDPSDSGPQPRGKQVLNPNSIWYTAVSGIWQTVWLEPVPEKFISELSMLPDLDGHKLRLTVHADAPGDFTAVARLAGKPVGKLSGKLNQESTIEISDIKAWSPDSPTLYDLDITLATGDHVTSYFGMRKIEIRKDAAGFNRIFLNNQPQFGIGPLDQGWWPDGLYTAPTDEALRSDIETLKKLGFNMCRKHVKVEPARYYYWCDKLGFMLWQDMPSAMPKGHTAVRRNGGADLAFTPAEDAIFRGELKALIHNLSNVTSIVAWVPFNEGWGQHDTNDILKWVKSLDPSRLVNAPSGWEDRGYGDMKDLHDYPGPSMYPVVSDRASVLGEFGGLGLPVEDHLWWNKRNWGYRTFEDRAKLQAGYEDLMQKLEPLVKQGLAAAIYTQTTDVEGEVNGLMTYDRKVVKYDAAKLAEWHRKLIAVGAGK